MLPAEHSSSVDLRFLDTVPKAPNAPMVIGGGEPISFVVELETGFKIYHSGDTAVFPGMALIHEFHKPDLAMVAIGGHYTMGPEGAAYAVKNLLKPKMVMPIHYGTYPSINRTPAEFRKALGTTSIRYYDPEPGEPLKF